MNNNCNNLNHHDSARKYEVMLERSFRDLLDTHKEKSTVEIERFEKWRDDFKREGITIKKQPHQPLDKNN